MKELNAIMVGALKEKITAKEFFGKFFGIPEAKEELAKINKKLKELRLKHQEVMESLRKDIADLEKNLSSPALLEREIQKAQEAENQKKSKLGFFTSFRNKIEGENFDLNEEKKRLALLALDTFIKTELSPSSEEITEEDVKEDIMEEISLYSNMLESIPDSYNNQREDLFRQKHALLELIRIFDAL